jgi:SAM-dependent methyltransferase
MLKLNNDPRYALNAVCPYFTMFPLEYPLSVLRRFNRPTVVLDPFCGRGTTLYAARLLGLDAWGIDVSPIAAAIARAKLSTGTAKSALSLAEELLRAPPSQVPNSKFFSLAFHSETLREVCALREGLMALKRETEGSTLLRAAALGCLHGPMNKRIENAAYFSNQMPRTFSSKPGYSVRYWEKHRLAAPNVRVLDVLARKLDRIPHDGLGAADTFKRVVTGDSQRQVAYYAVKRPVDVVLTSPPYYGMRTYVQDQWLRAWFLGGPESVDYSAGPQLIHFGHEAFARSLGEVWTRCSERAADSLQLFVRFGVIPSARVDAKELFFNSLESAKLRWRRISTRNAKSADVGKRQAEQMAAASKAIAEYDFHVEIR